MRFYQQSREFRIWLAVIWTAIPALWIILYFVHGWKHAYFPILWVIVGALQVGAAQSYWEITAQNLVTHSFGVHRTYKLARIDYVGPVLTMRRLLGKAVEVHYRDRQAMYITVADRAGFEVALRHAVQNHSPDPMTTGPLGLSV